MNPGTVMHTGTNPTAQLRRAFTLLELMVVIVLIGIVSAMIIPEMKGSYEEALLRSATRELADVCQLAYSRAVSMNQVHRLTIAGGSYRVEAGFNGRRGLTEFRALEGLRGYEGKIDERISVRLRKSTDDVSSESEGLSSRPGAGQEPTDGALLFYPDGTAEDAEMLLKDRLGFGLRLRVNPVTARVQISEIAKQ